MASRLLCMHAGTAKAHTVSGEVWADCAAGHLLFSHPYQALVVEKGGKKQDKDCGVRMVI